MLHQDVVAVVQPDIARPNVVQRGGDAVIEPLHKAILTGAARRLLQRRGDVYGGLHYLNHEKESQHGAKRERGHGEWGRRGRSGRMRWGKVEREGVVRQAWGFKGS